MVNATTHNITTVAGTLNSAGSSGNGVPGTNATLHNPHGLFMDTAGNLYIADSANQAVRILYTY